MDGNFKRSYTVAQIDIQRSDVIVYDKVFELVFEF